MTKAKSGEKGGQSPSQLIDARIAELGDWRGETLARIRKLIKEADRDVVEEWKWRGVPVWYHAGMICTGETYKNVVKLTFAKGASLDDPSSLFNSSLDGNTRRAIDIHEGPHPRRRRTEHFLEIKPSESGRLLDLVLVVGVLDVGRLSHRVVGFQRRT